MKHFALWSVIALVFYFVLVAINNFSALPGISRISGLIGKSDEQKFDELIGRLKYSEGLVTGIDFATVARYDGSTIAVDIGIESVKKSLIDPSSAKFRDAFLSHNPSTGDIHVCGFVNSKNKFGGYTGDQPYLVKLELADSIENSRGHSLLFFISLLDENQSYLKALSGRAGKVFYRACGNGFMITMAEEFGRL